MKNRMFFNVIILACAISASGQVQHGYVKTKGTPSQHGARLGNVTITVRNGNSVVSNDKGEFSFTVSGKQYSFSNVTKKGYVLTDNDFLRRNFALSNDWKVIVMEKPEQRAREIKEIEEKVAKTLEAEIKKKEALIAKLEKEGQKSASEIRKLKMNLYNAIEENEKLVSEMAQRFVSFDYDQMDDANRQVVDLILSGDLAGAKNVLDSQGNIDDRINDVKQMKDDTEKAQNSVADWCYNKYCVFNLENNVDSAAYYIKKRAEMDPTNLTWQLDAAAFFLRTRQEELANDYYEKALHFARWQASDKEPEHLALLAITLNNLALLYQNKGKNNVEAMHQEAATLFKQLVDAGDTNYEPYLASTFNNLGIYYSGIKGEETKGEKYYKMALDLYKKCSQDDVTLSATAGSIMNNLANLYNEMADFKESENLYKESLQLFRQLNESSPNLYDREIASSLNGLSTLYQHYDENDDDVESLTRESLSILNKLAKNNRTLYPELVSVLYNRANYYVKKGDEDNAQACYGEAIELCRPIQQQSMKTCAPLFFKVLTEQAMIDYRKGNYSESEALFREALQVCKSLNDSGDNSFMASQAMVLRHLAVLLDKRQQWQESEQVYLEELEINKLLASQDPQIYTSHVARSWGNMSSHALMMKDFEKAEKYALAGLELAPDKLFIYSNLAFAELFLGKTKEAREIFEYYKNDLKDTFLDDYNQYDSMGIIPAGRRGEVEKIVEMLKN